MNVVVNIADERLVFTMDRETLGDWALDEIEVETRPDGFHLILDEEEIVLTVADPVGFAGELAIVRQRNQVSEIADEEGAARTTPLAAEPDIGLKRGGISRWVLGVDPEEQFEDVRQRISALGSLLTDESVAPAELFGRWLRLLKEINRRHGQGAMPTPLFYRLNTELLDLIPVPASIPSAAVTESQQRFTQP
ncbi:MAG: hypothetical protein ACRDVL_04625 [Acidimicrobiia bacterium]